MSKSEKNWRRFYMIMMIFIYCFYIPIETFEWLSGSGGIPYTALVLGFAIPLLRKNHLNTIWDKEGKESS
ncbi:hypothetical protein [Virgibacillus sp. L01]|uniref:hypothetical protein n=1 Tax=Virgibacillus sp. L01 TaxID=3457429 RepID=UPI003FD19824